MFTKIRNKLEDFSRTKSGKEPVDREIIAFLQEKYKDNLDEYNTAKTEITNYFDNLELRAELLQNKRALDLGSNEHFFDEYCKAKYNTDFIALDIEADSLGQRHKFGIVADARSLPFKNESFDLVISNASMPHLFAPMTDDDSELIVIEREVEKQGLNDILSVFQESYRVLKVGGQIRMSTFSESEELHHQEMRSNRDIQIINKNGDYVPLDEEKSMNQQLARIRLVKKSLEVFEKESGAHCLFKDEKDGGLIVIMKVMK